MHVYIIICVYIIIYSRRRAGDRGPSEVATLPIETPGDASCVYFPIRLSYTIPDYNNICHDTI